MRRVDDELRDEVFLARLHAHASRAAAALLAIDRDGSALEVSLVAHRYCDLLVGDQVFELNLSTLVDNFGTPFVAVFVANFFQLFDDDCAQFFFVAQDFFVLGILRRISFSSFSSSSTES